MMRGLHQYHILVSAYIAFIRLNRSEGGQLQGNNADLPRGRAEEAQLRILPEVLGNVYKVALGQPSVFTCAAEVEAPERLTSMRWWYPNGRPVEPSSGANSGEFYEEERIEVLEGEQPGQIILFFSNFRNEDLGTYKCTALYDNNRQLTTSFQLGAYVPITFEDAPINQYAVKNSDFKLKCRVTAIPSPSIDWQKDHKPINPSERYTLTPDGILIRNVSEDDEGVYTCRARITSLGTLDERTIQLEVMERPTITVHQPPVLQEEGSTVTLACGASGKPRPEYEWVNNLKSKSTNSGRFIVDKEKGTLRIHGLKAEDRGSYTCLAKNAAGVDMMSTTLDVITKPVIEEFKSVTSQVGSTTVLTCRASGQPAPNIAFQKDTKSRPFNAGTQPDTRIFTEQRKEGSVTTGRIKIHNVFRADDGLYKCIASNSKMQTERLGHLTVEFPPSFANTPMNKAFSWDGKPVNLTCRAEAIPNATITWIYRSQPEHRITKKSLPHFKIFGTSSVSTLQVSPPMRQRQGLYQCTATNKLGSATHQIHLEEARRPGQTLQVITGEKTATSIGFSIRAGANYGLPILRFLAQYKEGMSDSWDDAEVVAWPADQETFLVEKLEPLRWYQFRFAASNAFGVGHFSERQFELTPGNPEQQPPEAVGDVYSNNNEPGDIELYWNMIPSVFRSILSLVSPLP